MPAPRPRRTPPDPEGLRLFVRLARIAVETADADGPSHAELRRELHLLEQESQRARPRPALALARVDEVVAGFGGKVSTDRRAARRGPRRRAPSAPRPVLR